MDVLPKINYCPHPAAGEDFVQLYQELMMRVNDGLIHCQSNGDLRLFNYARSCMFGKNWDKYTLMARGLILDVKEKKIVGFCIPKFFNFGEVEVYLPDEPFVTTEKLDGSLGIIYFHNNDWHVSTRGSFFSEQAKWAEAWLYANVDIDVLQVGYTYCSEIIYHDNQIVVRYPYDGLAALTAYDHKGFELTRRSKGFYQDLKTAGFRIAEEKEFGSLEDMLEIAKSLSGDEEGFVVRFNNGFRLKIKGDEYVRLHRIIADCTPIRIWESMANMDDLEVIRQQLPEEMRIDFDNMAKIIQSEVDDLIEGIESLYNLVLDRFDGKKGAAFDKALGLYIKDVIRQEKSIESGFLFLCHKKNFLVEIDKQGPMRKKLFNVVKPKNNRLKGYISSTAMNRFNEEEDS